MANTRLGSANVFATLPFDQIDGVAGLFVHEDFETAALFADFGDGTGLICTTLGPWDWFTSEIAGAAVSNITIPASVADHVGIIKIEVGATSPAAGDGAAIQFGAGTVALQETYLPDTNGCYIASVLRVADVDAQTAEFGFVGQAPELPNAGASDIAGLVWAPDDSANVGDEFWIAQLNDGDSDTETVLSNVVYTESDWVLLEIALTSTGAHYRVTTEDATQTTFIAGTITVGMRPAFGVGNIGTNEEVLDIDLFHMRYLRRTALVGTGSDWLGQ
jgi:hypothetical protein